MGSQVPPVGGHVLGQTIHFLSWLAALGSHLKKKKVTEKIFSN